MRGKFAAISAAALALGFFASLTLTGPAGASYPAIPAGPIKLAATAPMSGPFAVVGMGQLAIAKADVATINKEGGIAGHKVQLLFGNDQDNPALGVSLAKKYIAEGAVAFIAPGCCDVLDTELPVIEKAKIPSIDQGAENYLGNPSKNPYMFTVGPTDHDDAVAIAKYAKTKGLTKVGVITDGSPYGDDLVSSFKAATAAQGVQIVGTQTYTATAVDVTTQLKELQQAGAQALVMLGESGFNIIFDGVLQIGWTAPLLGDVVTYDFATDVAGTSLASHTFATCAPGLTSDTISTSEDPNLNAIMKSYLAASNNSPEANPTVPQTFDSLKILKYAIQLEKSTSGPAIKAGILTIHDKSFTDPNYVYTFTNQSPRGHAGWAGADTMCAVTPLGQDNLPVRVSS